MASVKSRASVPIALIIVCAFVSVAESASVEALYTEINKLSAAQSLILALLQIFIEEIMFM